jgi:heme/copper-type cytochrome/quinol oxidase subunit 2
MRESSVDDDGWIVIVIAVVGSVCCLLAIAAVIGVVWRVRSNNDNDNNNNVGTSNDFNAVEMATAREDSHCNGLLLSLLRFLFFLNNHLQL